MRLLLTFLIVLVAVSLIACGGSGENKGGPNSTAVPASSVTGVTVTCSPTSISAEQTSQCGAIVAGTGDFSSTVKWTATGGGTINPNSGAFTGNVVQSAISVTITATSTQDSTKTGTVTVKVTPSAMVTSVVPSCSPAQLQTGQLTSCNALVNGTGSFISTVTWSSSGGTIDRVTGSFSAASAGTYTITAISQQNTTVSGSVSLAVVNGLNNVVPIVVDAGPTGNYANGAFVTVTVCVPGATSCQTINHVLVDTGSIGLRLLATGAAGGKLDPSGLTVEEDSFGNALSECNQFVDGFTWGSVALATIILGGETASGTPNSPSLGVPIQIIGDPRIPPVPTACSASGFDESSLDALGAYGVLGIGSFEQDCGPVCASSSSIPVVYHSCANGYCSPTFLGLAQQITNPVWALPTDNNGVVIQLPSVPSGGTTTVSGSLLLGIGTQSNNVLASATVLPADANAFMVTEFGGQANQCSYIDSGSNAYFFPARNVSSLASCVGSNSSFYCPASELSLSAVDTGDPGSGNIGTVVAFNIGSADVLFNSNNGQNTAFGELGGPNVSINGCSSFDWGLPFFFGKQVFTAIEGQPVSGTKYIGPFWAYQ